RAAAGETANSNAVELALWLEQDVCVLVEELVERPDFQVQARWPLEHLRAGADSAERHLVEAVDAGLVASAKRLAAFAHQPGVQSALLQLGPADQPSPKGQRTGHGPA